MQPQLRSHCPGGHAFHRAGGSPGKTACAPGESRIRVWGLVPRGPPLPIAGPRAQRWGTVLPRRGAVGQGTGSAAAWGLGLQSRNGTLGLCHWRQGAQLPVSSRAVPSCRLSERRASQGGEEALHLLLRSTPTPAPQWVCSLATERAHLRIGESYSPRVLYHVGASCSTEMGAHKMLRYPHSLVSLTPVGCGGVKGPRMWPRDIAGS